MHRRLLPQDHVLTLSLILIKPGTAVSDCPSEGLGKCGVVQPGAEALPDALNKLLLSSQQELAAAQSGGCNGSEGLDSSAAAARGAHQSFAARGAGCDGTPGAPAAVPLSPQPGSGSLSYPPKGRGGRQNGFVPVAAADVEVAGGALFAAHSEVLRLALQQLDATAAGSRSRCACFSYQVHVSAAPCRAELDGNLDSAVAMHERTSKNEERERER